MEKKLKIGIVGAGIQGISNALFLQKKDFNLENLKKNQAFYCVFKHILT